MGFDRDCNTMPPLPHSSTAPKGMTKHKSRGSINFDMSTSPDLEQLHIEKSLSELVADGQVFALLKQSLGKGMNWCTRYHQKHGWTQEAQQAQPANRSAVELLRNMQEDNEAADATRSFSNTAANGWAFDWPLLCSAFAHFDALCALAVPVCMSFADMHKLFEKDVEEVYGQPHSSRDIVRASRRIVIKVLPQGQGCTLVHANEDMLTRHPLLEFIQVDLTS